MKKVILFLLLTIPLFAQTTLFQSSKNSSTTLLDSAAVFTGAVEGPIAIYNSVAVTVLSAQAGTLQVQFGSKVTATTYIWIKTYEFTYTGGDAGAATKWLPIEAPYMRVIYTNSTVDQVSFNLVTMLHQQPSLINTVDGEPLFTTDNPAAVFNIPSYQDEVITANIAAGDSCSIALDLGDLRLKAIQLGDWTTASMTFLVSLDGVTYKSLWADGSEIIENATANTTFSVIPRYFYPYRYIQLRSGTSAADVDQTDARVIKLKIGNY